MPIDPTAGVDRGTLAGVNALLSDLRREVAALKTRAGYLPPNAVVSTNVAPGAIGASHILAGVINAGHITAGSIDATHIAALSINAGHIQALAINAGHIQANSISTGHIVAGTIQATDIQAGTITAAQIAATTITAANIVSGTITAAQIAAGTITATQIAAGTITAANITAGTITAAQIAAGTITATQIAAGTITAGNIAAGTITAANIAAGTITATQIAAGTITATQISAATITGGLIAAGTITATNIQAGTITGSLIAAGTITGGNLVAGTITATEISVSSLSAISANLGTITAGTITGAVFRSAATNPKVQMDATGIHARNAAGTITFFADAASGKITALQGIGGGNLLRDGSFEGIAPSPWQVAGGSVLTDTTNAKHGARIARIVGANTTGGNYYVFSNTADMRADVDENREYTFSFWIRSNTVARDVYAAIRFYDSGGAAIGSDHAGTVGPSVAGQYTRVFVTTTSPAGAVVAGVLCRFSNAQTIPTSEIHSIDALQLEEGALQTSFAPRPDEILPETVTGEEIANNTIIAGHMVTGTLTAATIGAAQINATHMTALSIATGSLQAGAVTAAKIEAGTITAAQIQAGSITGDRISANSISANNIQAGVHSLILNPSYEFDVAGWSVAAGGGTFLRTASATAPDGDYVLELDPTASPGTVGVGHKAIPVTPGASYFFSVTYKHLNGNGSHLVRMFEKTTYPAGDYVTLALSDSQTDLRTATANSTITTATRLDFVYTVPAGRYWVSPVVQNQNSTGNLQVDAVVMRTTDGGIITSGTYRGAIFETQATNPKIRFDATDGFFVADTGGVKVAKLNSNGLTLVASPDRDVPEDRLIEWTDPTDGSTVTKAFSWVEGTFRGSALSTERITATDNVGTYLYNKDPGGGIAPTTAGGYIGIYSAGATYTEAGLYPEDPGSGTGFASVVARAASAANGGSKITVSADDGPTGALDVLLLDQNRVSDFVLKPDDPVFHSGVLGALSGGWYPVGAAFSVRKGYVTVIGQMTGYVTSSANSTWEMQLRDAGGTARGTGTIALNAAMSANVHMTLPPCRILAAYNNPSTQNFTLWVRGVTGSAAVDASDRGYCWSAH